MEYTYLNREINWKFLLSNDFHNFIFQFLAIISRLCNFYFSTIFTHILLIYLNRDPMKKINKLIVLFFVLITIDAASSTHHLRGSLEEDHHDAFGRTRKSSSSSKNGGAGVFGFILGPILFIMAFPLMWNNEKKAAIDFRRLSLAKSMCE